LRQPAQSRFISCVAQNHHQATHRPAGQGNGPRDIGISIRGSNARNTFGIRNIVVLEDGFPVTQPDGLSRTDLMDPHAYGGVDVYRGPSSAMFGNYATGGAINFRLWRGGEINGARYGIEVAAASFNEGFNEVAFKSISWARPYHPPH
jgi:iron complex outermembrane recepter protein